jgi:hypothetical protein
MFEGDDLRFRPLRWEDGKWHVESHYPTQAQRGLEWGTQHLLVVSFSTLSIWTQVSAFKGE